MKKIIVTLFVAASVFSVAHAQTSTTITQDTANTARATCFSNGGTTDQCQAAYDAYIQAAGTTVSNTPAVQTSQPSSGSGFVALAPIPGLTQGVTADQAGLATFFNNLYKYLIGLAAILAVIEIIWGGLEISTKDSVSKQSDGKERITQAIFGLVLVLSPVLVFSIINPSILNLSLNLLPLDTKSGAPQATVTSPSGNTTGRFLPTTSSNTSSSTLYPCTDNATCSAAQKACLAKNTIQNAGQADIVCVTSDGTIDPNGRTDSSWNPFSSYACAANETLTVNCTQFGT
jgi:hypothetical protein